MSNCLFCNIIDGEIDADIIYQDEQMIAFEDIRPQAPHHILIIPRKHIPTLNDITDEETDLIGHMFLVAKDLAKDLHLAEEGYRTIFNCNKSAGQEVFHIHLHLLGGRQFSWPPG